jgi:hypothetical protein
VARLSHFSGLPCRRDAIHGLAPRAQSFPLKHDDIKFDSLSFEIVRAFFWREGADGGAHSVAGSSGGLSDEMLEFGKELFNEIQIG